MLNKIWQQNNYTISTDKSMLNSEMIHQFLTNSYWGKERTHTEIITSIENSLCFGVYDQDQQIGFARVITDFVLFANLVDVFILPSHQRRGLGKWLMNTIFDIPELSKIKTWMLGTKDAHELYKKVGFMPVQHPEWLMVRRKYKI